MAEPISIQQLKDASLDVKSLEEVVNGDENVVVTTRLGETYPSVKGAIKGVFENGGLPATPFDTKAKMTTDGASLADGDYAWVTDDTDANNGLYIKKSGEWVLAKYNVLKDTQDYMRRVAEKVELLDSSEHLDVFLDKNLNVYRYTDVNGEMYLTGLSDSVQKSIADILVDTEYAPKPDDNLELLTLTDNAGQVYSYFNDDGSLHLVNDVFINGVNVTDVNSDVTASKKQLKGILRQQVLLEKQVSSLKRLTPISLKSEDNLIKRMPFAIKTQTGFVCFYHKQIAGYDGDNTGSELWKAILTVDDELNITVGSNELFLAPDVEKGIVKHPMLGRTLDNRIMLVFEERTETTDPYQQYICYSNDEGVSFTEPESLVINGTPPSNSNVLGTTGEIIRTPTGRLVLPMATRGSKAFAALSDDDGVTWRYSSTIGGIGQEPSIRVDLDGNLLMDLRPVSTYERIKYKSYDDGENWTKFDTQELAAARSQGNLLFDDNLNLLINTYNANPAYERTHYTLSMSYDNGKTYDLHYMPYEPSMYIGYSHPIKWDDGIYIIFIEYADTFVDVNRNENVGVLTLNLKEVISNVNFN